MTSLKSILSPEIEESITQRSPELDERPAKRRKSITPPGITSGPATSQTSPSPKPPLVVLKDKDERKVKWLAGLSHEELLGVAQGAVWQVGGLHSTSCFSCKKPGTLLECYNCPRSYHRRCLDPPIHGNFKIDGPWFCPNCQLLRAPDGEGIGMVNGMVWNHKGRSGTQNVKVEVDVDNVTPLHRLSPPLPLVSRARTSRTPPMPAFVTSGDDSSDIKGTKRSRYRTLEGDIDDALGLLNRELEQASQRKVAMLELEKRLDATEQEARIWKGRAELLERDRRVGLASGGGRGEAEEGERLRSENRRLRDEVDELKAEIGRKEREWEEWKHKMRGFVDGK